MPRSVASVRPITFVSVCLVVAIGATLIAPPSALAAKKPKYQVVEGFEYPSQETSPSRQTKGDVEIECVSLLTSAYDFPDVFSITANDLQAIRTALKQAAPGSKDTPLENAERYYAPDAQGRMWVNPLGSPDGKRALFGFKVKVRNNTKHIIKMSDVRVYLKMPDRDEPVAPANDLLTYGKWILEAEQTFEQNRKKGIMDAIFNYPVGFSTAVFAYKFPNWDTANLMKKEVLPGFSSSGYVLFPVESGSPDVSVLFFEVPDKTDDAGAVTGRENFEFAYKKIDQKYWYDKNEKLWKRGDPPEGL